MKSEIKKYLVQLTVVILSGILSYYFPLAINYTKIKSDKILNGFDIATFSTILNITVSYIRYIYYKFIMKVNVDIISVAQESSELYYSENDVKEIVSYDIILKIHVTGRKKVFNNSLEVRCPELYLLQIGKKYSYIEEQEASEKYKIDLNSMLERTGDRKISVTREVCFKLLLEEHNKGNIDKLIVEKKGYNLLINFYSNGLKLIQK